MTQPGTEKIYYNLLAVHISGYIAPINLYGLSRSKFQRNKYLGFFTGCLHIMKQYFVPKIRCRKTAFFYQTLISTCGMLLLLDAFAVIPI